MDSLRSCLCLLVTLGGLAACGPPVEQPAAEAEPDELEPASITRFGERLLLFMEFPHLVRGEPVRFLAHLTLLESGEPVRAGSVTLYVGAESLTVDAPKRAGIFIPEASFAESGTFAGTLHVQAGDVDEVLDLGPLVVHASPEDARRAAEASAASPADALPFLMEQQWEERVLYAQAGPAQLVRRIVAPARTLPAEGASAVVAAPVAGLLSTAEGRPWPRTGDLLDAGQPLAAVMPLLSAPERAELRTRELDLAAQTVEVERALAEAEARQAFASAEQARVAKLREAGLSSQQQLDAADQEVTLAAGAVEAARRVKAALVDWTARQPAEVAGALLVHAPMAGTIVEAPRVPGESVAAGQALFRLVDPSRLWVEGRVSEFDLGRIGGQPAARVTFVALPGFAIDGAGGARLLHVAPEVDPVSRTVAIRYELPDAGGRLRAGMLAELELAAGTIDAAVAIPGLAVVVDQGDPTAYVMLEGELLQKRRLKLGERDGPLVQVLQGVEAGEHVATRGAAAIRLAALSPASFGAGHQH
jgi:membrane fusion protein, heavy metal efflux system